jgi:hypothetical protein
MSEPTQRPIEPKMTDEAKIAAHTPEQRAALWAQLKMQQRADYKAALQAQGYTEEQVEAKLAEIAESPQPTVTGLNPASAAVGGPDVVLSVYGTGFTAATEILFNLGVEPTTFVSDTEVTTVVKPSTASGPVTVPVSVVGAEESAPFEFTAA